MLEFVFIKINFFFQIIFMRTIFWLFCFVFVFAFAFSFWRYFFSKFAASISLSGSGSVRIGTKTFGWSFGYEKSIPVCCVLFYTLLAVYLAVFLVMKLVWMQNCCYLRKTPRMVEDIWWMVMIYAVYWWTIIVVFVFCVPFGTNWWLEQLFCILGAVWSWKLFSVALF